MDVAYAASREFGFNINKNSNIPEEFYRLGLDLGLNDYGYYAAPIVRKEVKRVMQYENKKR